MRMALIVLVANAFANEAEAFDFLFFPPGAFSKDTDAMNIELGITGYVIEDFEDEALVSGLTIYYSNTVPDTVIDKLPNLLKSVSQPWDGARTVGNSTTNVFFGNSFKYAQRIDFLFAPPVISVGVGLAGFQSLDTPMWPITDHRLFINGSLVGNTLEELAAPDWVPALSERNVYLRVDAEAGEVIHSIGFENIQAAPTTEDFLEFDHLAYMSRDPEIFADGFETGDASMWSSATP